MFHQTVKACMKTFATSRLSFESQNNYVIAYTQCIMNMGYRARARATRAIENADQQIS